MALFLSRMDDPGPSSAGFRRSNETSEATYPQEVGVADFFIFGGLETLGTLAIIGNLSLIVVLLRNKYLNRASFILMLSLAIADVLHGIVTISYFYPPIILKHQHIPYLGRRFYNIVDWTAWAITLTHMSAICLDRLIAIMLYDRYSIIITISRVRAYSMICWVFFLMTNVVFFFMNVCCIIQPLKGQNFYTFGYAPYDEWNIYVISYTPLEIATICVLSVSNPITLVQLYRRHKRKVALRMQGTQKISADSNPGLLKTQRSQWQRASTMLLEMSMKMGNRQVTNDVREIAARRANRQQQRILLQISVVALIFYAYMTAYYSAYYVAFMKTTAAMIFNSFFYSTTHMINPVIYFSLNKEMRQQLRTAIKDFIAFVRCQKRQQQFASTTSKVYTQREHTIDRGQPSHTSETSPLFSTTCHYKSTGPVEETIIQKETPIPEDVDTEDASELQLLTDENPKLSQRDRSALINELIKALQFDNQNSMNKEGPSDSGIVCEQKRVARQRQRHSADITPGVRQRTRSESAIREFNNNIPKRYLRMSSTLQLIANDVNDGYEILASKKFSSMSFEKRPLITREATDSDEDDNESPIKKSLRVDISTINGRITYDDSSEEEIAYL